MPSSPNGPRPGLQDRLARREDPWCGGRRHRQSV